MLSLLVWFAILSACFAFGAALLARLRARPDGLAEEFPLAVALGMGALSLLMLGIGLLGWLQAWVGIVLVCLLGLSGCRHLVRLARRLAAGLGTVRGWRLSMIPLILFFAAAGGMTLIGALAPATEADAGKAASIEPLVAKMKKLLGTEVKDVRASRRLADSPSCIVVDENDPTLQLQQLMKAMGTRELPDLKPILEVNPSHPIVTRLAACGDEEVVADGEQGGPQQKETYVLLANPTATAATVAVTLVFDDGTPAVTQAFAVGASSRVTLTPPVHFAAQFPAGTHRRFGVLVTSGGATPVPIVVERASYSTPVGGAPWAAGTNAAATRVR
jgi:hypothetical protein